MSDEELLEMCKEYLDYNPETGVFIWKKRYKSSHAKIGSEAGTTNPRGYRSIHFLNKHRRAHRLAFLMTYGYLPKCIDHINNIKDDNRIENLRECTQKQNVWNNKNSKNSKSGLKGVSWHKSSNKWMARIGFNKKMYFLGYFLCKYEAAKVYNEKAKEFFGEFAYLNNIEVKEDE